MSILISHVPGFNLNPPQTPFDPSRERVLDLLATYIGRSAIDRMIEAGTLVLIRGYENFPRLVIRAVLAAFPRPCCVFVQQQGVIYVDETCANRPGFATEFILCASFIAQGKDPVLSSILGLSSLDLYQHHMLGTKLRSPAGGYLRFLLAHKTISLKYSGMCIIEELLIGIPKLKLSLYPEKLIRTLSQLKLGQSIKVKDLFALALIHAQKASECTPDQLKEKGLDIYNRKHLRKHPASLSAAVKLCSEPLPPLFWFLPKNACSKALSGAFSYPIMALHPYCEDDWTAEQEFRLPEAGSSQMPVASANLRPFAKIKVRYCGTVSLSGYSAALLQTSAEDSLANEKTPLNTFPAVFCESQKFPVSIVSAEVSPTFDWAYLNLRIKDLGSQPIRALCTSWALQADRLRLSRKYHATIAFWAHTITPGADKDSGSIEQVQAEDWPASVTRIKALFCKMQSLPDLPLVILVCKVASERISVIASSTLYKDSHIKSGQYVTITGMFLAGNFTNRKQAWADRMFKHISLELDNLPYGRRNRELRRMAHDGDTNALVRLTLSACRHKSVEDRLAMLENAASRGNRKAATALCMLSLKNSVEHPGERTSRDTAQRLARFIDETDFPAVAELAYVSGNMLEQMPEDYRESLFETAALKLGNAKATYHYAMKLLEGAAPQSPPGARAYSQALAVYLLANSLARGLDPAVYDLAKCLALGIGVQADPERAAEILRHCRDRNFIPATYWYAGFIRAGTDFFTQSGSWRRELFMKGIEEGDPEVILMTALFYLFDMDKPKQDTNLIAYALLKRTRDTLCDQESAFILSQLSMRMTAEERKLAPLFDVWKALGISEPNVKLPLENRTARLEGQSLMHGSFVQELDSDSKEAISERFMSQIRFLTENSSPFAYGYSQVHPVEQDTRLRLTKFDGDESSRRKLKAELLIASSKYASPAQWSLGCLYPFFETGIECIAVVRMAFANDELAGAVLVAGYRTFDDDYQSVSFFDPLWPLMSKAYLVGETYRFKLYALCESLHIVDPSIPGIKANESPLGAGCEQLVFDFEHGRARFTSEILGIRHHVCQIAGIDFAMLKVHPVVRQNTGAAFMPVFISEKLFAACPGLKTHATAALTVEMHGWAEDLAVAPNTTTLN